MGGGEGGRGGGKGREKGRRREKERGRGKILIPGFRSRNNENNFPTVKSVSVTNVLECI
jgi:hypothetical protein